MGNAVPRLLCNYLAAFFLCGIAALAFPAVSRGAAPMQNSKLSVVFNPQKGSYEISSLGLEAPVLESHVGAEVDHQWVQSGEFPRHREALSTFKDELGGGQQDTITSRDLIPSPTLFASCIYIAIFPMEPSR